MAQFRVVFRDQQVGHRYRLLMGDRSRRFQRAAVGAVEDVRDEVLRLGRADIRGAGNFGSRWTEGLQGEVRRGGGSIRLDITHDVPYFTVFQFGKLIRGRPLLWIPLSFAADAQRIRARDYPGRLFRVNREGKAPLLLSRADKRPKYFGKASVRIPKKFHLLEIIRAVSSNLQRFFRIRLGER